VIDDSGGKKASLAGSGDTGAFEIHRKRFFAMDVGVV